MFGKVKELLDYKKQMDMLKKELEKIYTEYENKGIKIVIRGDQHIERIEVDGEEDKRLKDFLNDAMKESQKKVSKKMQGQMGGLGMPGL